MWHENFAIPCTFSVFVSLSAEYGWVELLEMNTNAILGMSDLSGELRFHLKKIM